MNDQPKAKTISKQNLDIANIEVDVPYSQGTKQLDRVHAVNLSLPEGDPLEGKELRFTVFNSELKTFIRGKSYAVVDIEERDRPDSQYGPDRTIVQVYDDQGKPVSVKKAGGGGGQFRRSLEDDLILEAVKRRSIGQTATAEVGQWLRNPESIRGFIGDPSVNDAVTRIIGKYWKAVERGLDNYLAGPTMPVKEKTAAAPAPVPSQPRQAAQQPAGKPPAVPNHAPPPTQAPAAAKPPVQDAPLQNVGDLFTRALKLKPSVSRDEILAALKYPKTIDDLPAAWIMACNLSEKKRNAKAAPAGQDKSAEELWGDMKRPPG